MYAHVLYCVVVARLGGPQAEFRFYRNFTGGRLASLYYVKPSSTLPTYDLILRLLHLYDSTTSTTTSHTSFYETTTEQYLGYTQYTEGNGGYETAI